MTVASLHLLGIVIPDVAQRRSGTGAPRPSREARRFPFRLRRPGTTGGGALLRRLPVAAVLLACASATPLRAADLGLSRATPVEGVPCDAPVVQTFSSVWLGHFSGGYSHYLGPGESIVLDWRDEKLCFPTQATCNRHVHAMRRDFHRPEGYFTCLPIR